MAAILGTWNPALWDWPDFESAIDATARGLGVVETWSVSNRKHGIAHGDRFYLLKVGNPPRGIVGSGLILSEPYSAPHRDGTPGKTTQLIDVEFERLVEPSQALPASVLLDQLPSTNWRPQASGTTIKPVDAQELETLWKLHIAEL